MNRCKECGAVNTNGSKFCTKKCRAAWKKTHDQKYKAHMKENKDPLLAQGITGRGVFDCDGNLS